MDISEYQALARKYSASQDTWEGGDVSKGLLIALLGMICEAGSCYAEIKKKIRDGDMYPGWKEELFEQLGDVFWYVCEIASTCEISMEDVAKHNLEKIEKCSKSMGSKEMFSHRVDSLLPKELRFPDRFEVSFEEIITKCYVDGEEQTTVKMIGSWRFGDSASWISMGDPLSDNHPDDDGYRYHDAFHLAFVAHFGWSPVARRQLLKLKKRPDHKEDEIEDGGRAKVIDEAIVALIWNSYSKLADIGEIDVGTISDKDIKLIMQICSHLECAPVQPVKWKNAIVDGFRVWKQLSENRGGIVSLNLDTHEFEYVGKQNA